jgi:ribonuclease HII
VSDPTTQPLATLRERVASLRSAASLRRWNLVLEVDPRAGARSLGRRCLRRAAEAEREQRRMRRLFAMRAKLMARGVGTLAGVDEVGVGPLAGPVVAAAVVLPERVDLPGLNDSKQVPRAARERLAQAIREQAVGCAIAEVEPREIDRLNIYRASLEAMRRAVVRLCEQLEVDHLFVDARQVPGVAIEQTAIVHGDAEDGSIAAASIVAKVHRDALMGRLDERHPGYGFAHHMGYATPEHLAALRQLGPSPAHRRSFAPVAEAGGWCRPQQLALPS